MSTAQNKAIVNRFNEAFINGNEDVVNELLADNVVNHAAPKGRPNGKESFYSFIHNFRQGFPGFKMVVQEQVAERDLVVTRTRIEATHSGEFFGIKSTNQQVEIDVIDIIRLENGKYAEHWAQSNIHEIIKQLSQ